MSANLNILHLSDLHFGRIDHVVLEKLKTFVSDPQHAVDMVILTGDLTQRARSAEFTAARAFLEGLGKPFFVPGNHDIPLYNLFDRVIFPYRKFCRHMQPFAGHYFENEHVAIYGFWTTNHLSIKSGTIRARDLEELEEHFQRTAQNKIRIIAAHHPLFGMQTSYLERLQKLNPHLLLWGHEHHAEVGYFERQGSLPLYISCGSSSSTRLRRQNNSFNLIKLRDAQAKVNIFMFNSELRDFENTEVFQSPLN